MASPSRRETYLTKSQAVLNSLIQKSRDRARIDEVDDNNTALHRHPRGRERLIVKDEAKAQILAARWNISVESLISRELRTRIYIHRMIFPPQSLYTATEQEFCVYHDWLITYGQVRDHLNDDVQAWERKTREELLDEHKRDSQDYEEKNAQGFPQYWPIKTEYPPERRTVLELDVMAIADLKVMKLHEGFYLDVWTITPALARGSAVKVVVEDISMESNRSACCLMMHNLLAPEALFESGFMDIFMPVGTHLTIKQPFLYLHDGRSPMIMTNHPTEVGMTGEVSEGQNNGRPSLKEELDLPSLFRQAKGLFARRLYYSTEILLSRGLKHVALRHGSNVWQDLLLYRCSVRHAISKFEGAIEDVMKVLRYFPNDLRALNAQATVLYHLGDLEECKALLKAHLPQLQECEFFDKEFWKHLKRKSENMNGVYNFVEMFQTAANRKYPRLPIGDYVRAVNVRMCNEDGKGRGLFATQDFKAGDLVLCEKATKIRFKTEFGNQINLLAPWPKQGSDAWLIPTIVQHILDNPSLAGEILAFRDQTRIRESIEFDEQGRPIIDAFKIDGILNLIQIQALPKFHVLLNRESGGDDLENRMHAHYNRGVWIKTSYINHACTRNVDRTFIGDMVIVTAVRVIKKGEEILFNYNASSADVQERNDRLQRYHGFKCGCSLCIEQRQEPQDIIDRRADIRGKLRDHVKESADQYVNSDDSDPWFQKGKTLCNDFQRSFGAGRTLKPELIEMMALWCIFLQKYDRDPTSDELTEIIAHCSGADLNGFRKFEPFWDDKLTNLGLLSKLSTALKEEGKDRQARRVKKLFKETVGRATALGEETTEDWDQMMKDAEDGWLGSWSSSLETDEDDEVGSSSTSE